VLVNPIALMIPYPTKQPTPFDSADRGCCLNLA
jgi:hypothetical protein